MKRRITIGLSRLSAVLAGAVLVGAMTIIVGASAARDAHADPVGPGVPRTGNHVGTGLPISVAGQTYGTYLYGVDTGESGGPLVAYCVDFHSSYAPGVPLKELPRTDLGSAADLDGAHVGWILHHSYPELSLDEVASASGLAFNDGVSAAEAITATQAAIWLFTDGITLDAGPVLGSPAEQSDVAALYGYLTGAANTGLAVGTEPLLRLHSDAAIDGSRAPIGPISVTSTAEFVTLDATEFPGATIVDSDGTPVESAVDGDQVYVDIPADAASGIVTVTATTLALQRGWRLYAPVAEGSPAATQKLAVATTEERTLRAQLPVAWTPATATPPAPPVDSAAPAPPAPAPATAPSAAPVTRQVAAAPDPPAGDTPSSSRELAYTGLSTMQSLAVAITMILGGTALAAMGRRRRT